MLGGGASQLPYWTYSAQTPEQMADIMAFFADLHEETTRRGELVDTAGLADPAMAQTVRRGETASVATDGPFVEMKEVLASYAIYDLESSARAMEIAGRVAQATGGTVEVRPAMDFGGADS